MGGNKKQMILFQYNGQDHYLYPIVSARYAFDTRSVYVNQTYNDTAYLRMKLNFPHRLIAVQHSDYVILRNFYYELCNTLFSPTITYLKDASKNLAYFRVTAPKEKGGLSMELDAIVLVEKNFDYKQSYAAGVVIKRFLRFTKDGLKFLETYYGSLPF